MGNRYRGIAQLVEQWSPKPRAEGSSPSAPAKYADVAQVVAHILGKDEVTSSSLVISSNRKTSKNGFARLFLDVFFLCLDLILGAKKPLKSERVGVVF